ncbi:MAG: hypothetical protein U1F52_15940 [Burkholderiales bacterium]
MIAGTPPPLAAAAEPETLSFRRTPLDTAGGTVALGLALTVVLVALLRWLH